MRPEILVVKRTPQVDLNKAKTRFERIDDGFKRIRVGQSIDLARSMRDEINAVLSRQSITDRTSRHWLIKTPVHQLGKTEFGFRMNNEQHPNGKGSPCGNGCGSTCRAFDVHGQWLEELRGENTDKTEKQNPSTLNKRSLQ